MSTKEHTDESDEVTRVSPNDFHTASGPTWLNTPQRADENLLAEQVARAAVASGGIDIDLLAALDSPPPSANRITERFHTWVASAEHGRLRDTQIDAETLHSVTVDGEGRRARKRSAIDTDTATLEEELTRLEQRKIDCDTLLAGKPRQEDGAIFAGSPPEETPVLAVHGDGAPASVRQARRWLGLRPAMVKHFFAEGGLIIAAGVIEGVMLIAPIQQATYSRNVVDAVLLATGAIVSATLLPHLIGQELAALRRGAAFTWRRSWVLLLLAFWPLCAVLIGVLREQHVETIAGFVREQSGSAVPGLPFNALFQLILWPVLLLLVGVVVMVIKMLTWNPVRNEILRVNTALALTRWRLSRLAADRAELDAEQREHDAFVATHEAVMAATQDAWRHHVTHILPALRDEALAVHDASMADALGQPEATGLIAEARSRRTPVLSPVAPLPPRDPEADARRRA